MISCKSNKRKNCNNENFVAFFALKLRNTIKELIKKLPVKIKEKLKEIYVVIYLIYKYSLFKIINKIHQQLMLKLFT